MKSKSIIVAPLNWGIGHATRCIPIIQSLKNAGYNVIMASDGNALVFLINRFPNTAFVNLPSYNIKYGHRSTLLPFLYRWPLILLAIYKENKVLKRLLLKYDCSGVISDNRLGFYNKNIPSYYITHQLNIKSPSVFITSIGNIVHHYFMKKFKGVWVPDYSDSALAGELSKSIENIDSTYINSLTRFNESKKIETVRDFIIILSGIEPQRSLLEKKLRSKLDKSSYSYLIVQGKLGSKVEIANTKNFLAEKDLIYETSRSKIIISRAGYSSIMDWVGLNHQALLIPTPGQTEQEYLAQHLGSHPLFVSQAQKGIDLEKAINHLKVKEEQKTDMQSYQFDLESFFKEKFSY